MLLIILLKRHLIVLQINFNLWYNKNMKIIQSPSPNFYSRSGNKADIVVIHCTDGRFPGDLNWLCKSAAQVSAHFLIAPDGAIHQLVALDKAAWHAGRISYPTVVLKRSLSGSYINPNKYSTGIEVSMLASKIMSENQLKSLHWLIKEHLKSKLPGFILDRQHIWGHKEINSRKICPGTINVDALVRDLNPPSPVEAKKKEKEIKIIVDDVVVYSYKFNENPR